MTETTGSSKPKAVLHGVLVNVGDVGVLITGEAGTGKSECALALITRHGHQLVADDVVEVTRTDAALFGRCAPGMECLLNVRDLGILRVAEATTEVQQHIHLNVHFKDGPDSGNEREPFSEELEILAVSIPRIVIHNCRMRNLSLMVETAAARFGAAGVIDIEKDFLRRYNSDLLHA